MLVGERMICIKTPACLPGIARTFLHDGENVISGGQENTSFTFVASYHAA